MVTPPQTSTAVATPVTFVRVSPGQERVRSAGVFSVGAVRSSTVIICAQLVRLLQELMAVQVRVMMRALPHTFVKTSAKVTVTALHVSVAVAVPVAAGATDAPHSTVTFDGQVMTGGVMSR